MSKPGIPGPRLKARAARAPPLLESGMESSIPSAVARAAALLEKHPSSWRRPTGGYTPAERYVVRFADGSSCFAKAATNAMTGSWLRDEYRLVYSRFSALFLPKLLGWEDDELPLLVLEDLSDARWPPPWSRDGEYDTAFWLPSLHSEGGPAPEEVLPDASHWAAAVSGFFAERRVCL